MPSKRQRFLQRFQSSSKSSRPPTYETSTAESTSGVQTPPVHLSSQADGDDSIPAVNDLGVTVLYDGKDATVDIVLVHGTY